MGFTYDESVDAAGCKLFINGEEKSRSVTGNSLSDSIIVSNSLKIGADGATLTLFFNVKISNVCIYDKELSTTEVQEVYNSGVIADNTQLSTANNLTGYWRMGNNSTYDGTMVTLTSVNIIEDSPNQHIDYVLPNVYDLLVYKFDENMSPYVNTGTVGTSANLSQVGVLYPQQQDQWKTNKSLGLGTTDADRYYAYGASSVNPSYPITVS